MESTPPPPSPAPITGPYVLLVEGKDDLNLFDHLVTHYNLPEIDIRCYDGKNELPVVFPALVKTPGFDNTLSVGITKDADDAALNAFKSVCNIIKKAGQEPPKSYSEFSDSIPHIGVMILPDNNSRGMIEDVCLRSVKDDPAMPCVDEFFSCLEGEGLDLPGNMSKAKAQAFLASRKKPGISIGVAAQRKYWPVNESFEGIEKFLRRLCSFKCVKLI